MPIVEIQTPTVSGKFEAKLVDVAGNGNIDIVRANEEWKIDASWYLDGTFAPAITGTWHLQAQVQGSDDVVTEFRQPAVPHSITLNTSMIGPGSPYTDSIVFPAGQFTPLLTSVDSIVLDVVVTLNFRNPDGTPGPMAAFVDLGKVQVYA
jgi:hypothetical protein